MIKNLKWKYEYTVIFLLIVSSITILFNDLMFGKFKSIIFYDENIHNLLSNVSLAYISGWIFYYLVVVLKERRDKKNVYEAVVRSLGTIHNSIYMGVLGYLVECSGGEVLWKKFINEKINYMNISQDQVNRLCNNIDFKKELEVFSRINNVDGKFPEQIAKDMKKGFFHIKLGIPLPITYEGLIYFYGHETFIREYDRIMKFVPHLESELVRMLNQIYDYNIIDNIFASVNTYPSYIELSGRDEYYSDCFYRYFQQMKGLRLYNEAAKKRILKEKIGK